MLYNCSSIVAEGLNVYEQCGIQQASVGQFAHIPVSKALQTVVSSKVLNSILVTCTLSS